MDWEFGISRCKLLHIEWINQKALLYNLGSYIQQPVINHNGKNMKKNVCLCVCVCVCVCVCIKLNHFAVHQKLTHCKSTTIQ